MSVLRRVRGPRKGRAVPSGMRSTDGGRTVAGRLRPPNQRVDHASTHHPSPVVADIADPVVEFDAGAGSACYRQLAQLQPVVHVTSDRVKVWGNPAQARGYDAYMADAIAQLAYQYLTSGAVRVSRVLFEGLCAVRPDWSYARLGLGVCYLMQSDLQAARASLEMAVGLDPYDAQARLNLAELAIRQRHPSRALQHLKDVEGLPRVTDRQRRRALGLAKLLQGGRS